MDNKKVFFEILKQEFSPKLREIGFKGSGQNFRRVNKEVINTINIQVDKYGGGCAVNLGLHLTFLPLCWADKLPDIENIKEIDCEFRMRLAPKNKTDYWWKYGGMLSPPSKKAHHLIETYFTYGEPHFQTFNTIEKVSNMLSVEDIKKSDYINVFGGVISQRGALAMARIHKHLGDITKAKEFASFGLDNLGTAIALRSAFEEIIDAT